MGKFRWTNEELKRVSEDGNDPIYVLGFILQLIRERMHGLNPYAPLYKALKMAESYIENEM